LEKKKTEGKLGEGADATSPLEGKRGGKGKTALGPRFRNSSPLPSKETEEGEGSGRKRRGKVAD